ncbi:hypothetical protein [Bradyrhizobium sp. C9]|uniref:hypothetical protein n=1 Tax=Bradyrhizobium sp. C9 TaxID=142585 RepID=UPI001178742A|nr:hypothetical protein [Bradyrhizobium sp. C9]
MTDDPTAARLDLNRHHARTELGQLILHLRLRATERRKRDSRMIAHQRIARARARSPRFGLSPADGRGCDDHGDQDRSMIAVVADDPGRSSLVDVTGPCEVIA